MRSVEMYVVVVSCVLLSAGALHADEGQVSPRDYELYMAWKDGREDPRLEKFNEAVKLRKIARSLRVRKKELRAVIDRVEPLAPTLQANTEQSIRKAFEATPVADRVLKVEVNVDTGHVIAWIKWRCGDERDRDKEAAWVAWAVGQGGYVVKTTGLWCVNSIDTKLFSAKIGRAAFERVRKEAIERFASSRYIRLFEEVKRGPHR